MSTTPYFHKDRYVPGLVYTNMPENICPPGLEATQGVGAKPPIYVPVSFGASREWASDKDGWQTVQYKKKGKKARKWREVSHTSPTEEVAATSD